MILALDLATRTGFAYGEIGAPVPVFGARTFRSDEPGEAIARFRGWLSAMIFNVKPTRIAFESPYINPHKVNMMVIRRLAAMAEFTLATAWELKIDIREHRPSEITKFFTGRANMKREEKKRVTIDMCHRYGWQTLDDDAADALALWAMIEASIDAGAARCRGEGTLFARSLA